MIINGFGIRGNLALQYFDRVEDIVDVAWTLSVREDVAFPRTEGQEPCDTDLTDRYISRLLRGPHGDPVLREAFVEVLMIGRPV